MSGEGELYQEGAVVASKFPNFRLAPSKTGESGNRNWHVIVGDSLIKVHTLHSVLIHSKLVLTIFSYNFSYFYQITEVSVLISPTVSQVNISLSSGKVHDSNRSSQF